MIKKKSKNKNRIKRHERLRNKVSGTAERPRLNVFRSNKHIYAQLIDDAAGTTVAAASSKALEDSLSATSTGEAAKAVGKAIGEAALAKGYKSVVFDRGGYIYHGRVKSLAEAAREAGLEF